MRTLANALGVGAMSLYNHVRDKADLESLLLDAISAPVATQIKGTWDERAKAVLRAMRTALDRHPGLVPLLLKRPTTSETALQPIEELLAALNAGGFKGRALLHAYHTLFGFLTGSVLTDLTGTFSVKSRRAVSDVAQDVLELDGTLFPHLKSCAAIAMRSKPGEEFEYGLSAVLAGLRVIEGIGV